MTEPLYWLNGRSVSAAEAVIPLTDHGLLYGDGIFEGIRFYNNRPFRLSEHLQRLEHSARALMLVLPYRRAELETAIAGMIEAFAAEQGYIRLVVTRGRGSLGLDPTRCERPNVFMIADRVALVEDDRRQRGIDLVTTSTRRPGPTMLDPRIKSLNYLNNILAKLEARHAGADEALLLNDRGYVVEGTAENLFIVRDGRLLTPPVSDGALDGVTRSVILELCRQEGLEVSERSLTPYDLHTAEECFLCGTGAELLPVRAVDGRPLTACPGPLSMQIERAFRKLVSHETRTGSSK